MKKAHKDFLTREQTRGILRLAYDYNPATEEYWIVLQSFYTGVWQNDGVLVRDTSFNRIEAVWVFLIKQDVSVWLKAERY